MNLPRFLFCRLPVLLGLAVLLHGEPSTIATTRELAREALAAEEEKNYPVFLAKMTEAVALRPDYPRLLVNLAEAQTVNGQEAKAVATLERVAALGMHSPVDQAKVFAGLRGRKDFKTVVAHLEANLRPIGAGEIDFTLRDMTGLVEGIAWREKPREFLFGDVNQRTIWVRSASGSVRRFCAPDQSLWGIFGLVLDEDHGTLWAATTAVSAMQGYAPEQSGMAGLAEFDLGTGRLRRVVSLPHDGQEHVLGDLALASDGSVLVPDSGASVIWRLAAGAEALERFIAHEEFISLQGLVILPDGTIFAADHANGLLRIDSVNHTVQRMASPHSTTMIGIDGLSLAPNGDLIAVQNGLRPKRILRLTLDAGGNAVTQITVLESAHLVMAEPALGCIAGNDFVFIGNAGWSRFEKTGVKPTAPRPIPILRTKL